MSSNTNWLQRILKLSEKRIARNCRALNILFRTFLHLFPIAIVCSSYILAWRQEAAIWMQFQWQVINTHNSGIKYIFIKTSNNICIIKRKSFVLFRYLNLKIISKRIRYLSHTSSKYWIVTILECVRTLCHKMDCIIPHYSQIVGKVFLFQKI